MKKKLIPAVAIVLLLLLSGCKSSDDLNNNKLSYDDSVLDQEQFIGKMFWHQQPPGEAMDVFMADVYVILRGNATTLTAPELKLSMKRPAAIRHGINRMADVEINGGFAAGAVINSEYSIDPSQYRFIVKNVENLTHSPHEDSSVNVNSRNRIVFISDRTGKYEIFYMDISDKVQHQLTPINGQYAGPNTDPGWKTDDIVVFSSQGKIIEVDLNTMQVSDPLIPEENWTMYDPKYSPDHTKILFSAWVKGKKNGYQKDMVSGTLSHVLPNQYFSNRDDNPNWLFSNTRITGHFFYPEKKGRIYIKDGPADFSIITPANKDFRYVTPVQVFGTIFLVFSDWSWGEFNSRLWIANEDGSNLRPLNQGGDEAVFIFLNLPIPKTKGELERTAQIYNARFRK